MFNKQCTKVGCFAVSLFLFLSTETYSQTIFSDATTDAQIDHHYAGFVYGGGVVCADFNNDSYLDIFLTDGDGYPNRLYLNQKNGSFEEAAAQANLDDRHQSVGAVAGDIDNDGDLDLYLANYSDENKLYLNDGAGHFTDVTGDAGVGDPGPGTSVAMVDYNNDGFLDIFVLNRSLNIDYPCKFYRNNQDGTFTDVAEETGTNYVGVSLGIGFFDFDNDRDLDIYLADELDFDAIYRNNGNGTYTNIAKAIDLRSTAGMGIDFADYDNDGDFDVYVGDYYEDPLFRNNGDGTFTDVALNAGIKNERVGWGINFFDYDNDGDKDLYVLNGSMIGQRKDDHNVFYRNNGNSTFSRMNDDFGLSDDGDGRGSACADFNNDGYVDLFVVNVLRGKSKLFMNQGGANNWTKLKLEGTVSNRSGIGARVEVISGTKKQIDEVRAGSSYASMNSLELEFGLGQHSQIDSIIVYWPSGIQQVLTDQPVNKLLKITETPGVTSVDAQGEIPEKFLLFQNYPNPFNPRTEIRYQLERNGLVQLKIIDVMGREVRSFRKVRQQAGEYLITWDGTDNQGRFVPSGIYFYQLAFQDREGNRFSETKKMTLLK